MSCPVMLPCNWKAWQLHYPSHGYQHCKETALMTCYTVSVKTFSCSLLPLTCSFPMIGENSWHCSTNTERLKTKVTKKAAPACGVICQAIIVVHSHLFRMCSQSAQVRHTIRKFK